MLILTDSSVKSLETARTIHRIASAAGIRRIYLVGNRVHDANEVERIRNFATRYALPVTEMIPFDPSVTEADIEGRSPVFLTESIAVQSVEHLADMVLEVT
jgi:CO dehydrogenase nickel-insertion accessory protein CooC1